MSHEIEGRPEYRHTMARLEAHRHVSSGGSEYWFAREIQEVLGYDQWRNFEGVLERASQSMRSNGIEPSDHIVETNKMVALGSGAERSVTDMFLSRAACYLIAMNGDPSKPEIAAAQAYFAVQTRLRELGSSDSNDEKRLEEREKVKVAFKTVSGVAQEAGVTGPRQGLFHNARYEGLYNQTSTDYRNSRGLKRRENPFDRMGVLELSAHNFQMNLAAETLAEERVRGETAAIRKNREIAQRVRKTMIDSGATPECLPVEEPIKDVQRRLNTQKLKSLPSSSA